MPEMIIGGRSGLKVITFKKLLPVGEVVYPDGTTGYRKHPLIQFITDPGGVRTAAVGNVRLHNPVA